MQTHPYSSTTAERERKKKTQFIQHSNPHKHDPSSLPPKTSQTPHHRHRSHNFPPFAYHTQAENVKPLHQISLLPISPPQCNPSPPKMSSHAKIKFCTTHHDPFQFSSPKKNSTPPLPPGLSVPQTLSLYFVFLPPGREIRTGRKGRSRRQISIRRYDR